MSDQHVDLVAIMTPAPGKSERMKEELLKFSKMVHEKEPETLRYHLHQEEGGDFVLIERYLNQRAFENHMTSPDFQNLMKLGAEEQLLSKPPELKKLTPIGGYESK
ncbi:hypothetical protein MMC13_005355 [Lambiella insularis]|nr:hypothetical protein [Lambiella insularis]